MSRAAYDAIADGQQVFVGVASAWEIATKVRIGKWDAAAGLIADWPAQRAAEEFSELPITSAHARRAGRMAGSNKDPFDRIIVAQAELDGLRPVSADGRLKDFGADVIW